MILTGVIMTRLIKDFNLRSWAVEFEEDILDREAGLQEKVDIFSFLEWRRRVPNFLHLSEARQPPSLPSSFPLSCFLP